MWEPPTRSPQQASSYYSIIKANDWHIWRKLREIQEQTLRVYSYSPVVLPTCIYRWVRNTDNLCRKGHIQQQVNPTLKVFQLLDCPNTHNSPGAYRIFMIMSAVDLEVSVLIRYKKLAAAWLSSTADSGLERWYQRHPMKAERSRWTVAAARLPAPGALELHC